MVKVYQSQQVGELQTAYQALRSKGSKTKKAMAVGALVALTGLAKLFGAPSILPGSFAFDAVLGGVMVVGLGGLKLKMITHTSDKEHAQKLANYLQYNQEVGKLIEKAYQDLDACAERFLPQGPLFPRELEDEQKNVQSDLVTIDGRQGRFGVDIREKVPYRRIDHIVNNEEFVMLARLEKGEKIIEFFTDAESREKRIAELYQRPQQQKIRNLPKQLLEGSTVLYTPLIKGAKGKIRPLLTNRDFLLDFHGAIAELQVSHDPLTRYLTKEAIKQDQEAYEQTVMNIEGPKTWFKRLSKRNGMFPLVSIDSQGNAYLQFFESQTARQRFIADFYKVLPEYYTV